VKEPLSPREEEMKEERGWSMYSFSQAGSLVMIHQRNNRSNERYTYMKGFTLRN
jgi:hypothetical protein